MIVKNELHGKNVLHKIIFYKKTIMYVIAIIERTNLVKAMLKFVLFPLSILQQSIFQFNSRVTLV